MIKTKKKQKYLILPLLFFCSMTVYAAPESTAELPSGLPYADLEDTVDEYVEENQDTTVGMTCAVFDRDQILFQKEYGYADKENQIALTEDSVLDWGSVSKTLIWVSAMQLWESGQLDLEKDVREYLPEGFLDELRYDTPITMIDLMNHQGGFQDNLTDMYLQDYDRVLPLNEQLQKNMPVQVFEPGTVTAYSNWGSSLAAYVIECVSGQSFDNYVKEHIFEPLGMEHTAIRPDLSDQEGVLEKRLETKAYWSDGTKRSVSFYHISLYPCGMCAGTMNDFILYAQALIPDEDRPCPLFKNAETLEILLSPTSYIGDSDNARICHGFLMTYYGVPVFGHGGNSYACSTQLNIDPESGIGTLVMTNQFSEEVYTKKMMPLIYGTYDTTSNLGMPQTSDQQYTRFSNTIWEGSLSIFNMLMFKTVYTNPDSNVPYFFMEKEGRIEFAEAVDLVVIPAHTFFFDTILILLLPVIFLYLLVSGGIHGLIVRPLQKHKQKKLNLAYAPDLLKRWHYISCGLIAVWFLNLIIIYYQVLFANAPTEHYLWQIAMNGILGLLMIGAILWMIRKRKKYVQKGFWKIAPFITGFCLLVTVIIIIRFDMYQFWRL